MTPAILAIADRLAPRFRRAFLAAVAALDRDLTTRTILDALARGDIRALDATGAWETFAARLEPDLRAAVLDAVTAAGRATVQQLPASIAVQLAFDRTNPQALAAVDTVVREALQDLTGASRDAIRTVLRIGFSEGWTPEQMARRIRDNLGLTERYATAVEHYRQGLVDTDVPAGRADELTGRYADRLLRARATMIARTESVRALSAGQQGAWLDAARQGLLDRSGVRRHWVVTDDDRLCPLCEAIPELNPEGVGLDEPFQSGLGIIRHPPLHPLCRCVVTLHFLKDAMAA